MKEFARRSIDGGAEDGGHVITVHVLPVPLVELFALGRSEEISWASGCFIASSDRMECGEGAIEG